MAFAVVLHLSPEHESNLAPILQKHTSMPVIQVNEEHAVEPNHVYVIPPNRQLEMLDGVVRCTESVEKSGARIAIDTFFRTLAEAYERNAVCVVLSGTGADGTLGLKRVKESNGFAIVQDPDDAEYDRYAAQRDCDESRRLGFARPADAGKPDALPRQLRAPAYDERRRGKSRATKSTPTNLCARL